MTLTEYSISEDDCICRPGYKNKVGTTCSLCGQGTYQNRANRATCEPCPANTYSLQYGNDNVNDCTDCAQNKVSDAGSILKSSCLSDQGFFTHENGSALGCPAGTYQDTLGATDCKNCIDGLSLLADDLITVYSTVIESTSSDSCQSCPDNSLIDGDEGGDELSDCVCDYGYVGNDGGPCVACLPGKFKNSYGNTTAELCGIGTYSDSSAASICTNCPASKTTTLQEGASSLGECECVAGYHGTGGEDCNECEAGNKCEGELVAMVECPGGTYSEAQASSCSACYNNSDSPPGSGSIEACVCNEGYVAGMVGENHCNVCGVAAGPGKYEEGGQCISCAKGSYLLNTAPSLSQPHVSCSQCPAHSTTNGNGTYALTTRDACKCLEGYQASPEGEEFFCQPCNAGSFKGTTSNTAQCQECGANKYSAQAATECTSCPPNSLSPPSSTSIAACNCDAGFESVTSVLGSCQQCTPGSFKGVSGNVACTLCEAGTFMENYEAHECDLCPENKFMQTEGASVCTDCRSKSKRLVPGDATAADSDDADDCLCDSGHTLHDSTCKVCPEGTYKESSGNGDCDLCPSGKSTSGATSSPSSALCSSCVGGTYSLVSLVEESWSQNKQVCQTCYEGSASPAESDAITDCICNAGFSLHVTASSTRSCVECPLGYYKSGPGNENCTLCDSGTVGVVYEDETLRLIKAEACDICGTNTFQNGQICTGCPGNTFSDIKSSNILDCKCIMGFEGVDGSACTACSTGKYKNTTGSGICTNCARGKYLDSEGGIQCLSCATHATSNVNSDNVSDCFCNAGYERSTDLMTKGTECHLCAAGKYSLGDRQQCRSCSSNHFYSPSAPPYTTDTCQMCPEHSLTEVSSPYTNNDCICDIGYLRNASALDGSIVCQKCLAGSFCPDQLTSTQCPVNSNSLPKSASLDDCFCKAGFYGESGACTICGADTYCPVGSTEASPCRPHSSTLTLGGRSTSTSCVCDVGYFETANFTCQLCPVGSYCYNNEEEECPGNSTSIQGSDAITACKCHAGFYMQVDGISLERSCVKCAADVLCTGGDAEPQNCAQNSVVQGFNCVCNGGLHCVGNNGSQWDDTSCESPNICQSCGIGTYCSNNQKFTCHGNSTSVIMSDDKTDCVCLLGFYKDHDLCHPCPKDSYCANDIQNECHAFDPNLVTLDTYQSDFSSCECKPGYFRLTQYDLCKPCALDFYCYSESEIALPNVAPCLPNEYTYELGSTSRADCICDTGNKLDATGQVTICLPCGEGERCQAGEVLEFQCHFQLRTANADHSKCVCMVGYEENNAGQCQPCGDGFVKNIIGDQKCQPCPVNTFSVNVTHCQACPPNSIAPVGSAECTCSSPYTDELNEGMCQFCPQTQYYQVGLSVYFEGSCHNCTPHSTAVDIPGSPGWRSCECDPGYVRDNTNLVCVACEAGKFESNDECVSCGYSATSAIASSSQDDCVCNTTVCNLKASWLDCVNTCEDDPKNCTICGPGTFRVGLSSVGNDDDCQPCAFDKYQPDSGADFCLSCPVTRQTITSGATALSDCICRPGFEPNNDPDSFDINCTKCQPGTFKPESGNEVCTPCPVGSFISTEGATSCLSCASEATIENANTTLNTGADSVEKCVCLSGYYLSSEDICDRCVVGSFKSQKGFQACEFCGANVTHYGLHLINHYGSGEDGAVSVDHCQQCPGNGLSSGRPHENIGPGFPMDDVNKCLCFPGYDTFTDTSGCLACDNYTKRDTFSHNDCVWCDENEYFIGANEECPMCTLLDQEESEPTHSVAVNSVFGGLRWGVAESDCTCNPGAERVADRCRRCSPGSFRKDIFTAACEQCPNNQYEDGYRSIACTDCPLNSFTVGTGQMSLDSCLCLAGFEWTGSACSACPVGHFKAVNDSNLVTRGTPAEQCQQCPDGTYVDHEGAIVCKACGANERSELPRDAVSRCICKPGFGDQPCSPCPHGTFNEGNTLQDQHAECSECPSFKNTSHIQNTAITACKCVAGTGIDVISTPDNNAACSLCISGKYAPGGDNILCYSCGFGTVTEPEFGAASFDQCMCNHDIGLYEVD